MPRGKRRKKLVTEEKVSSNHTVMVTAYPEQGVVDIAYPNRQRSGFYWHHIKGLPAADARGILECLRRIDKDGGLEP